MRIRYKKWARPELEASKFYIDKPEECKGKWREQFEKKENPIHLELGCGKGQFISKKASNNLNINYIAIDLVDAMLGLAKRNVEQEYSEKEIEPKNILLTRFDIERINLILDEKDKVERIYINFCNPWPKGKHRKKRLTHTRQLEKYKQFLAPNAEIYFKTDDEDLFNSSLIYFEESGFNIISKTYDLHNEPIFEDNIETEHEKMFSEQGIKIKALIAKRIKDEMKFGLSNDILKKIIEIVKKNNKYKFKIFGSRAKNTYKRTSDIDIAIFENVTKQDKYKIMNEFDLLDIIYKVDLVFVNDNTKKEFRDEIEKEAIEIN